ncbi:tRNA pseudouridine(55) synthase TruB [Enterococcus sp. LJL51]|uniref:tRNA pseudouridine(55) synthase TruB n=1 Tax=Enterococcus sp. LJL51 TaxID=3416656 RepID=UPI003CEA0EBE
MDGILPLWKESGMTSHDCVFKLRKILHTKKIGHGGTLDPDVSGVLPICIGKGTKVIEYMVDSGKTYEGEITLGISTTTEDASGDVVEQKSITTPFPVEKIDWAMEQMLGEITQIPPMYSAVKVNGRRLYDYARNGEEVERPKRTALIHSFERTSTPQLDKEKGTQSWRFKVVCGKGTYVRTLSVDTGTLLGVPAHMSELVRTASGGLRQDQCLTLAEVAEKMEAGEINQVLLPIETAVKDFPAFYLTDEQYNKVRNGVFLTMKELGITDMPAELIALYHHDLVVSLYKQHEEKSHLLKPSKVLRNN